MRRGFKTEAERISIETRLEMDLTHTDRLDPFALAAHLAIPVYTMAQAAAQSPGSSFARYFSLTDPESFSAVTVFSGYRRFIVHNENHHPNRQASNLTHEISHTILGHEPTPVAHANGHRYWDGDIEEEATWLGAALLVPREGAVALAKEDWGASDIAEHYGVSDQLCRWRIAKCGIDKQIERWRKYRG